MMLSLGKAYYKIIIHYITPSASNTAVFSQHNPDNHISILMAPTKAIYLFIVNLVV